MQHLTVIYTLKSSAIIEQQEQETPQHIEQIQQQQKIQTLKSEIFIPLNMQRLSMKEWKKKVKSKSLTCLDAHGPEARDTELLSGPVTLHPLLKV